MSVGSVDFARVEEHKIFLGKRSAERVTPAQRGASHGGHEFEMLAIPVSLDEQWLFEGREHREQDSANLSWRGHVAPGTTAHPCTCGTNPAIGNTCVPIKLY